MVYDINYKSAKLCKLAAIEVEKATGRRRFCAGAVGPTNRTLSISPKVENAAFRNITFMELVGAYKDQVKDMFSLSLSLSLSRCVCVCVCVCARARARVCVCVCTYP